MQMNFLCHFEYGWDFFEKNFKALFVNTWFSGFYLEKLLICKGGIRGPAPPYLLTDNITCMHNFFKF